MLNYTANNDVIIDIYWTGAKGSSVGFESSYTDIVHPGSNKKIQGWQWDRRVWPTIKELDAIGYAPSIWDPVSSFLTDDYWQSGIGDNKDLLLLSIRDVVLEDDELWVPQVNHGYFYEYNTEWFLFSDDYKIEHFYNNQLFSGVQYVDLEYKPKPGIPIQAKRYRWDKDERKYLKDLDLRKKVEFTGVEVDDIEQDTTNADGNISFENINANRQEFVVDYDFGSTPRVYTNKDYSEAIIHSGDFVNYEMVGVSNGQQEIFNLEYSPVDPSGQVEIVSYLASGAYTWWNRIDSVQDFAFGEPYEYKLDEVLGAVTFWSGFVPEIGSKIIARYTKGLEVEYEPERSRDYILADGADVNPLNHPFNAGFVLASLKDLGPTVVLTSDYDTGSDYQTDLASVAGKLIATVEDAEGRAFENQNVTFELFNPVIGSISSSNAFTDKDGQASLYTVLQLYLRI